MYLKQLEREYALACGGAAGASGECQKQADKISKISKLRQLGDSVLETEYIVVGSDMGPDHSIANQPGDIVACANSVNGFCQVTGEAIETPAGKEWKLVAASDTEAAEQVQRNKQAVERASLAAQKLALEAFESGCNGVGISATACQLYKALGGANPISGYEPTTNERLLAGAGAILNALGLVGAIRGGGLSGSAAESSIDSGAKEIGTITTRTTKNTTRLGGEAGEPGIKITYKDGTEFDMTSTRVKETEANPYVPGATRPIRYEDSLYNKGIKRAPTQQELDWFNSITW
ncbi:pre-toxin TG domain-containing protein [Pseudomonas fakonensis]|uniref:Pre-toxin TG domain-containing protein n=1 Tax=Pseudomonas fakonensis TaxID=2842355 RepID=A0ABX8NDW0_9PSED|nr:pre-toxin TG domain-containing protein [Pseudomonas fakonensis]QXH53688.1 pre-toxin TG domain-containing protein [Pseudomonas fakonensis]